MYEYAIETSGTGVRAARQDDGIVGSKKTDWFLNLVEFNCLAWDGRVVRGYDA